jgi:hypothetical protein
MGNIEMPNSPKLKSPRSVFSQIRLNQIATGSRTTLTIKENHLNKDSNRNINFNQPGIGRSLYQYLLLFLC